jgi:hypothetical protein
MQTRLTLLSLALLAGCGQPPAPQPVAPESREWRIPLPPVSAPPVAWQDHRPASPAAAATVRGDRLFVQVDDHCGLGIHAHTTLQRDSVFVVVHWGSVTERATEAAPNCYTNCDVACPILFSGLLPFPPGEHVVAILFPAAVPGEESREGWRIVAAR